MDSVLLKNYAPKSSVVAKETFISKAMYPAIDIHSHNYPTDVHAIEQAGQALDEWVKVLECSLPQQD